MTITSRILTNITTLRRLNLVTLLLILFCAVQISACCCLDFGPSDEEGTEELDEIFQIEKVTPQSEDAASHSTSSSTTIQTSRQANVDAVWYRSRPLSGGTSPISVRVTPTPSGMPAVGVMEQYVNGTGEMWQASAWMAAINASRITGHMLGDHEFMVKSGGFIDGPSAGMLLTSTMVALIRGDEILKHATMTGTVNPNGTAGAVGGVGYKLQGAKNSGKTIFGYPQGLERVQDPVTGQQVDIKVLANRLGIKAVEVKDIHDAYQVLTGRELPRQKPATERDMSLGKEGTKFFQRFVIGIRANQEAWIKKISDKLKGIKDPVAFKSLIKELKQIAQLSTEADSFAKQEAWEMAYYRTLQFFVLQKKFERKVHYHHAIRLGKYKEALTMNFQCQTSVTAELKALEPEISTLANQGVLEDQVNVVKSLQAYAVAKFELGVSVKDHEQAGKSFNAQVKGKTAQETAQKMLKMFREMEQPLMRCAKAGAYVELAKMQLKPAQSSSKHPPAKPDRLISIARAYASGGLAGLSNLNHMFVTQLGGANHTMNQKMSHFATVEPDYFMALHFSNESKAYSMEMDRGNLGYEAMNMASASLSYAMSGDLLNKHTEFLFDSKTQTVRHRGLLKSRLFDARVQARRSAARCKEKLGFIPWASRLSYQIGVGLLGSSSDAERLHALSQLEAAMFWAELAINLDA